jgi:hypothetical protein
MVYLQRTKARPMPEDLSPGEAQFIHRAFDAYAGEVLVDGQAVAWNEIKEVEIAVSPRAAGPAGWLVRHMVHGNERYHVGLYFGRQEAIVPNVTLKVAQYIVQCIAYYAPLPIRYNGPDGLVPVIDE